MKIKAIVFDVCGLLLKPGTFKYLRKQFEPVLGISAEEQRNAFHKHWFDWRVGRISENEFFKTFLKDLHSDEKLAPKLKKIAYAFHKPTKLRSFVKRLRRKGYLIAGLSNHAREWTEYEEKKFRLAELFDVLLYSFEARAAKPEKAAYVMLLRKLRKFGVHAEECVFIDDLKHNLEPARKLGMKTVLYENERQLKKELRRLGVEF